MSISAATVVRRYRRYRPSATRPRPAMRMISIPVSPWCELVRWLLDERGIAYVEECHVPFLHVAPARRVGATPEVPGLVTPDGTFSGARAIVSYLDVSGEWAPLFPPDPGARVEAQRLYDRFDGPLGLAVRRWAYAHMLPDRGSGVRVWGAGAPASERLVLPAAYPVLAALMRRVLGITEDTVSTDLATIDSIFDEVADLLADGRHYVAGETISVADQALASLAAPVVAPDQYGGPLPALEEMPSEMRAHVDRLRAHPAGQFILRLYREDRPRPTGLPASVDTAPSATSWPASVVASLTRPATARLGFEALRRYAPVFTLGSRVIVSRRADVIDVLARDTEFTISEINGPRFEFLGAPFILGMDRGPQYEREHGVLRSVVREDDLETIRGVTAQAAAELIETARPRGRIDVAGGLGRLVPARLVASYFGVSGPDEQTLMRWLREAFHYAFLSDGRDPTVRIAAAHTAVEMRRWMEAEMARRKDTDGPESSEEPGDVLGRLLALQGPERSWLDDDTVRRNVGGLIVGAVDTTSTFVVLALDELLRRPEQLAAAREAALAGDVETVRRYAYEAVRFNPHTTVVVRHVPQDAVVAAGTARERRVAAGSTVVIGILSAMFDPRDVARPDAFDADRPEPYLQFGHGMHQCFGLAINGVQIPEIVAAALRLPNLRRAHGPAGRIAYDGPFPDRLMLEFDGVAA